MNKPRWHQSLAFRFSLVLTLALVAFDLLREPLGDLAMRLLRLDAIDHTSHTLAGALLSGMIAIVVATLLAIALSRWLTGRLARLSRLAAEPGEDEELPGPFDDRGHDEIAIVAAAMNSLRDRVSEQIKAFALQDLRRREWIAQVSHDLRTPLTAQLACLNRADLILEKSEGSHGNEELRELLAVAKMDADRVHTLADDLLEIARLDAGDKLNLEPVPPGELIRQAARRLEPLASQKGVAISVNVTPRLPVLHADGRRLTRAIENLMRNAIQHASSSVEVIAKDSVSGPCVRFEVRDDGAGLPKQRGFLDYLRRLSRDVRLTELSRRRSRSDSAGLGLVVAQRVAEAHEGVIDAYNLSSGGAAFWIDIPVPEEVTPSNVDSIAG